MSTTHFEGRMLLAEANQWPEDAVNYFGNGDECHTAFHFPLMPRLFIAVQMEDRFPIVETLADTPAIPDVCQWMLFLRNHDELTLEMVTDEERDYMYRAYARDPQARINLGIRRRLAPLMQNNRRHDRIAQRLAPFAARHAGHLLRRRARHGRQHLSRRSQRRAHADAVELQSQRRILQRRPAAVVSARDRRLRISLRNASTSKRSKRIPIRCSAWMQRLIGLRQQSRALGRGTFELLQPNNPKVLAFVRGSTMGERARAGRRESLAVSAIRGTRSGVAGGQVPVEMFGQGEFPQIGQVALPADDRGRTASIGSRIRPPAPLQRCGRDGCPAQEAGPGDAASAARRSTANGTTCSRGPSRRKLEKLLPGFLRFAAAGSAARLERFAPRRISDVIPDRGRRKRQSRVVLCKWTTTTASRSSI